MLENVTHVQITRKLLHFSDCLLGAEPNVKRGLDQSMEMLDTILKRSLPKMTAGEFTSLQSAVIFDLLKLDEEVSVPFLTVFKQIMRHGDLSERLISCPAKFRGKMKGWSKIEQASAIFKAYSSFNGQRD